MSRTMLIGTVPILVRDNLKMQCSLEMEEVVERWVFLFEREKLR